MQKILNFRVSFNFSFFLSAAFLFQHFRQFVSSFVRLLAVSISVSICVFMPRRFTLSRLICLSCKKYFFLQLSVCCVDFIVYTFIVKPNEFYFLHLSVSRVDSVFVSLAIF